MSKFPNCPNNILYIFLFVLIQDPVKNHALYLSVTPLQSFKIQNSTFSFFSFWRRKWQPTAVFLPGQTHGQRSLVGYSPWGCKESDTTEQLRQTIIFFRFFITLAVLTSPGSCPSFIPQSERVCFTKINLNIFSKKTTQVMLCPCYCITSGDPKCHLVLFIIDDAKLVDFVQTTHPTFLKQP